MEMGEKEKILKCDNTVARAVMKRQRIGYMECEVFSHYVASIPGVVRAFRVPRELEHLVRDHARWPDEVERLS